MDFVEIIGTDDCPGVILDAESGRIEISGQSMPENVSDFYDPVVSWIKEYVKDPKPITEVAFKMNYFNTASSKKLLDILSNVEPVKKLGKELIIKWYFDSDDEDMKEAGEDYQEMVKMPFEFISNNG